MVVVDENEVKEEKGTVQGSVTQSRTKIGRKTRQNAAHLNPDGRPLSPLAFLRLTFQNRFLLVTLNL
jgi:hypothetical protein